MSAREEIGKQNVHVVIKPGCGAPGSRGTRERASEWYNIIQAQQEPQVIAREKERGAQAKAAQEKWKCKAIPHSGSTTVSLERGREPQGVGKASDGRPNEPCLVETFKQAFRRV